MTDHALSHPEPLSARSREVRNRALVRWWLYAVLVVLFGFVPPIIGTQYDLAAVVVSRVFGGAP